MCFNLYFNAMGVVIDGHISVPFECEQMMQLIEPSSKAFSIKMLTASKQ